MSTMKKQRHGWQHTLFINKPTTEFHGFHKPYEISIYLSLNFHIQQTVRLKAVSKPNKVMLFLPKTASLQLLEAYSTGNQLAKHPPQVYTNKSTVNVPHKKHTYKFIQSKVGIFN